MKNRAVLKVYDCVQGSPRDSQELLGALASSLAEQQAEQRPLGPLNQFGITRSASQELPQHRVPKHAQLSQLNILPANHQYWQSAAQPTQHSQQFPSALAESLKEQHFESQRIAAQTSHPPAQLEAERAAIQATAEAIRQRREAEVFLEQYAIHSQTTQQSSIQAHKSDTSSPHPMYMNSKLSAAQQKHGMPTQLGTNQLVQPTLPLASGASPGAQSINGSKVTSVHTSLPGPAMPVKATLATLPISSQPHPLVCDFCGRWLSEMTLDQGNHMCDEFWEYNAEFQARGAQCALLIGGVHHLKREHLQSFILRFPGIRRVKHGSSLDEFNGLFLLTDEQRQTQALRLLANCNVRAIPLGHAASWRCLHVQLIAGKSLQRVGQVEQALQNKVIWALQHQQARSTESKLPSSFSQMPDENADLSAVARGKFASEAWELRALETKRRADLQPQSVGQPNLNYFISPQIMSGGGGPGSTPGDWKCSNCGNINFAFREKCNRCNTPRPGARMFGQSAASERRICPFTVMLMRVPSHASELQVAEALLQFGDIAPGGVKFHRQGSKVKSS